jgi:hypothetical protein
VWGFRVNSSTSVQQTYDASGAYYLGTLFKAGTSTPGLVLAPASNRNFIPSSASGSITSYSSVTTRWTGPAVTGIVLRFPWYFVTSSAVETLVGHGATATASIEYPAGTRTQCVARVGGGTSLTITDGSNLDMTCPVSIPAKTKFWVHIHFDFGAAGTLLSNIILSSTTADRNENNGIDKTMSGTVTANVTAAPGGANGYSPLVAGFIAPTDRGDIAIGDSILASIQEITAGNYVASVDTFGNVGWFDKVWHGLNSAGVWNFSRASSGAFQWSGNMTRRIDCVRGMNACRVINALGHNDLGSSVATLVSNQGIINNLLLPSVKKIIMAKLTPYTTSTDSFITAANQTLVGTNNADYNTAVAAGSISGQTGFIDLMNAFQDQVTGQQIWPYDGVTANKFTPEGVHPNPPAVTQAVSRLAFPT